MARAELPEYAREWLLKDEEGSYRQKSIGKLASRVEASTFVVYYSSLHSFFHRIGKTPDETVDWARSIQDRYPILDLVQDFVDSRKQLRYKSKRLDYASLRSFFMHNRVELPRDRGYKIRGDLPPVDRKLRIEHIRTLIGLATEPWRSAYLAKWHGFFDNQGLIYTSNHHTELIVHALKTGADLVRLPMPGRKNNKNRLSFETFLSLEPLEMIRAYFDNVRGWPKKGEPIWVYDTKLHKGHPIRVRQFQDIWMHLLRRAKIPLEGEGVGPGIRYGYNMHNTRDLAISHLVEIGELKEVCVEYWSGHEVDPLQYRDLSLKPKWVEAQYRLAIPYLSLLTAGPPSQETKELRDKVANLELAVKMLQEASGLKVAIPAAGAETKK